MSSRSAYSVSSRTGRATHKNPVSINSNSNNKKDLIERRMEGDKADPWVDEPLNSLKLPQKPDFGAEPGKPSPCLQEPARSV